MTFPRTMLLISSVDSQARNAGYNNLEFALPEITSLFILGDIDWVREENYFIHFFFFNFVEHIYSFPTKNNEGRFVEGICLLHHWYPLFFSCQVVFCLSLKKFTISRIIGVKWAPL